MEAKDAVKAAKSYVAEIFGDEDISQIGLEELEYDESGDAWLVTIGFKRPWKRSYEIAKGSFSLTPLDYPNRWYKLVRIDAKLGRPVSITDRELVRAA